jgi:radical SAM protein with 4Fe4S-binding SPASM domain
VDFQNWREEDEGKTNKKIIIQKQKWQKIKNKKKINKNMCRSCVSVYLCNDACLILEYTRHVVSGKKIISSVLCLIYFAKTLFHSSGILSRTIMTQEVYDFKYMYK